MEDDVISEFSSIVDDVVEAYEGAIQVTACNEDATHTLRVYFENTEIAGRKERVRSLALSVPGTIIPVYLIIINSPVWFPVWHFPWNVSHYKMDLESNAEAVNKLLKRPPGTLSFSGSRLRQIEKQCSRIKNEIIKTIKRFEAHNRKIE